MKFKNSEIYVINEQFDKLFPMNLILPIKVNFYLSKNLKKFKELSQEIDEQRMFIGEKFGEMGPDGSYSIKPEFLDKAQEDLDKLSFLEQEVDIYTVKLEDLENIDLTREQMEALLFMIEE